MSNQGGTYHAVAANRFRSDTMLPDSGQAAIPNGSCRTGTKSRRLQARLLTITTLLLATLASPGQAATLTPGQAGAISAVINMLLADGDVAPTLALATPGGLMTAPSTIPLRATAGGDSYLISTVEFLNAQNQVIATAARSDSDWTGLWAGLAAGTYTVTARAKNSQGAVIATSASVSFTVIAATEPSDSTPIAVAITPPHLTNADAGSLPGEVKVNENSGAATYSIALVVPPGSNGMQPGLSLDYSSLAGNGIAGYGWSLGGTSGVHRCIQTTAQDGKPAPITLANSPSSDGKYGADALCLDDQRLILTSGSYAQPGSTYTTEMERYSRITASGSSGQIGYFTVETRDGQIKYYGGRPDGTGTDSQMKANGKFDANKNPVTVAVPVSWTLSKVQDRAGNAIVYSYSQDAGTGEHLLSSIQYGNAGTLYNKVVFGYECRNGDTTSPANCSGADRIANNDADIGYFAGARADFRHRLKTVTTYAANAAGVANAITAQVYTLNYVQGSTSGRSLLDNVKACDGSGNCLPVTQFGWGTQSGGNAFVGTALGNGPSGYWSQNFAPPDLPTSTVASDYKKLVGGLQTGDFLGNGKQVVMTADHDGWHFYSVNTAGTGFDATHLTYSANPSLPKLAFGPAATAMAGNFGGDVVYTGPVLLGDFAGTGRTGVAFLDVQLPEHGVSDSGPVPNTLNTYTGTGKWVVCLSQSNSSISFDCRSFALSTTPDPVYGKSPYQEMVQWAPEASQVIDYGTGSTYWNRSNNTYLTTFDTTGSGRSDVLFWGAKMTPPGLGSTNGTLSRSGPDLRCRYISPPTGSTNWNWDCNTYDGVYGAISGGDTVAFLTTNLLTMNFNAGQSSASTPQAMQGDFWGIGQSSFVSSRHKYTRIQFGSGVYQFEGPVVTGEELVSCVPSSANFNNCPIGASGARNNQFVWSATDPTRAMNRYSMKVSPGLEAGGSRLGSLTGGGYTDLLFTYEGHSEVCYSNGLDGFDCRLIQDDTPANYNGAGTLTILGAWPSSASFGYWDYVRVVGGPPPSVQPNANGLFSYYSLLSIGHAHDGNLTQAIYRRGNDNSRGVGVYAVCAVRNGKATNCSEWTGPVIRPDSFIISTNQPNSTYLNLYIPDAGGLVGDFTGRGRTEMLWYGSLPQCPAGTSVSQMAGFDTRTLWRSGGQNYGNGSACSPEGPGWRLYTPNTNGPLDRLVKVVNGFGNTIEIDYKPMSDTSVYSRLPSDGSTLAAPLRFVTDGGRMLVAAVRRDPGDGSRLTTGYRYEGMASDPSGRGEAGFRSVVRTEPSGIQYTTTYAQGFPFSGMALSSKTVAANGAVLDSTSNTLSDQQTRWSSGLPSVTRYTRSNYVANAAPVSLSHFVYANASTSTLRDLDNSDLGNKTRTELYDDWGNLKQQVLTQIAANQTFTTTVTQVYDNQVDGVDRDGSTNCIAAGQGWLVGRLCRTTVKRDNPTGSQVLSVSRVTDYSYDARGMLTSETIEPGNAALSVVTSYVRNTAGLVTDKNQSWAWPAGYSPPTSQAASRNEHVDYDGLNRFPAGRRNALGQSESYVHDPATGIRTSLTGPNGFVTSWMVDGLGRISKEVRADKTETRSYLKRCQSDCPPDAAVVAISDSLYNNGAARIAVPTLEYRDSAGHVLQNRTYGFDGRTIVSDREYDGFGRLARQYQPRFTGETTRLAQAYAYDALDRIIEQARPDKSNNGAGCILPTTIASAANDRCAHDWTQYQGLKRTQTNAKSQVRVESRDALGQLDQVQDPLNGLTRFEHDPFGNMVKTIDPANNVITVAYDALGRRIDLKDPDLGWIHYDIDPLGRSWRQITPRQRSAGLATTTYHDALGRMIARIEPDLDGRWIYDHATTPASCAATRSCGQLIEAYTLAGSIKDYRRLHGYDSLGRPWITQTILDAVYTSTSTYDAWGRPMRQSHQRGSSAVKNYDNRYNGYGYLARIERNGLKLWSANLQDSANRVLHAQLGNGLVDRDSYDPDSGRPDTLAVQRGDGSTVQSETYLYDAIGNVSNRTQIWGATTVAESFGYDKLNRLVTSTVSQGSGSPYIQTVNYSADGNIRNKTGAGSGDFVYPPAGNGTAGSSIRPHAVQSIPGLSGSFAYDANGNQTEGNGRKTSWSHFDLPICIAQGTGAAYDSLGRCSGGADWSQFTYGSEHQRTKQIKGSGAASGVKSTIYYSGAYGIAQEAEILASGPTVVRTYWPQGIGEEIETFLASGALSETKLVWLHGDRLGSVMGVTDQTGQLVESLAFDAWGKRRTVNALPISGQASTAAATGSTNTPTALNGVQDVKGFTGHEMLDTLDLVHMNGRLYDPLIGRFTSADPNITDPLDGQNYNRYSYVLNNPTNLTDPTGFDNSEAEEEKQKQRQWEGLTASGKAKAFANAQNGKGDGYGSESRTALTPGQRSNDQSSSIQSTGSFSATGGRDPQGLPSALLDTGKGAWNAVVGLAEGGANLIGGYAIPGAPDYVPFMDGLRPGYDTPSFGKTIEVLLTLGTLKVLREIGTATRTDTIKSAEAMADTAQKAGRTSGAAAELRVGDRVFVDVSTGGAPRNLHPKVQAALDKVPQEKRAPWHGHCAEPGCLSQSLYSGVNPAGGASRAVNIGKSGRGHGTEKKACSSCRDLLDQFGVKHD